MATIRLNAHVGHEKIRISVGRKQTLATLAEEISKRWSRLHEGEKLDLAELRTADNVLLDKMDVVGEVLRDDETLVCVTGRSKKDECRVGDMILHYYLTSLLGEGTYGMVFKAHDLNLNRYVAVKVLRIKKANDVNVRRFLREAELNASLSTDPHIVTVHDFGRTRHGRFYLVMEMLEGQALNDVLDFRIHNKIPFTTLEIIDVISPVLRGLHTAHSHVPHVIHRDLKPDNVWVNKGALEKNQRTRSEDSPFTRTPVHHPTDEYMPDENEEEAKGSSSSSESSSSSFENSSSSRSSRPRNNNRPALRRFGPYAAKIMDFGIAVHEKMRHETLACGTRMYASPEQTRRNVPLDARSDIWSVGVIMYQMMTLLYDMPFDPVDVHMGGEVPDIKKHLVEGFPVPRALTDLVTMCLQKDPNRRFQSATDMLSVLQKLENGVMRARMGEKLGTGTQFQLEQVTRSGSKL